MKRQAVNFDVRGPHGTFQMRLDLDLDQMSQEQILKSLQFKGCYEPDVFNFMLSVLRPGDVFMDIGAHVGFFSILAGHIVGPTGLGLAVEPMGDNQAAFENHMQLNELSHVQLYKGVVSDQAGREEIYFNADNDGGHALWDPGTHDFNVKSRENPTKFQVDAYSLSQLVETHQLEKVKVAKIDTEGAEVKILSAQNDLLQSGLFDFILCELNESALHSMGASSQELFDCARKNGLEVYLPSGSAAVPKRLPEGVFFNANHVINLLFAKPETLKEYWQQEPPVIQPTA